MNKTKKILAVALVALVAITCVMLSGCNNGGNTVSHVHEFTRIAPKAATCTENGNREYYVCNGCDEVFGDEDGTLVITPEQYIIPAKGHKVASHGEKPATCFSLGIKEYYECRACGMFFKDADGMFAIDTPQTTPMLTHSLSKVDKQPAVGFKPGFEEHYACANCNKIYKDATALVETTYDAIKIAPTLTDFEYKIAFTPAANLENNGHITAKYVKDDAGLTATEFTIAANTPGGTSTYAWINQAVSQTMPQGINLRIPTFSGKARSLEMTVTNKGGDTVTFEYYAENNGHKGGVTISVASGETKTVTFEVNPGGSIGCNYVLKLVNGVSTETKLVINGYMHCEGEVSSIDIYREASKKTFKVGDAFSTEGLVIKANGDKYDEVVIANYMTDIEEGYVFTASDVGTKTVTVAYGEYTVSYQITVTQ